MLKFFCKGAINMCIFCKIINGEIPSYKIYEDEYTYVFLDIAKAHAVVPTHAELSGIYDPNKTLADYLVTNDLGIDDEGLLDPTSDIYNIDTKFKEDKICQYHSAVFITKP